MTLWSPGVGRVLCFVSGLLVMTVCGTGYAFGAYSSQLKSIAHLDQSGIDLVGSIGTIGGYLGPLSSVLLAAFGPARVLTLASVCTFLGYGAMVMGVRGVWAMGTGGYGSCYFVANVGTNMLYYTALTVNVKNLPPKRTGLVVAVLVSLYGISAAMFTLLYNTVFHSANLAGYLLMCGVALSGAGLSAVPFVRTYPRDAAPVDDLAAAAKDTGAVVDYASGMVVAPSQPLLTPVAGSDDEPYPAAEVLPGAGFDKQAVWQHQQQHRARDNSMAHTGLSSHGSGSSEAERETLKWMRAQFVRLYTNPWFLLCSAIHMLGTGSGLMHINNLSNLVKAIHGGVDDHDASTYVVSLLSICNCSGRLAMGASDLFRVRRGWWLFVVLCTLSCANFVMAGYVTTIAQLYVASVFIGLSYGSLWSILPTICSESFGRSDFSYNFGWLTASSAFGSPSFNAVFGAVYDSHNLPGTTDCIGPHCYVVSYFVTGSCSALAAVLTLLLTPRTEYGKKTPHELAAINAAIAAAEAGTLTSGTAASPSLLPPQLRAGTPASSVVNSGFAPLHNPTTGARITIAARPDHSDSDDSAVGGGLSAGAPAMPAL